MKREFNLLGFTLLELILIITLVCIGVLMSIPRLSDVKESKMAADMQKDLINVRMALEEYYSKAGEYPTLVGVENLEEVVSTDGSVNFGKILGRKTLPKTPRVQELESSYKIYDVSDFTEVTENGGWNYNQSEGTGEVHVNLPKNVFGQEIDWNRQ